MNFLNITLFAWFFLTSLLNWLVPRKYQLHFMIFSTAVFMFVFAPASLVILLLSSIAVYSLMQKDKKNLSIGLTLIALISSVFIYYKVKTDFSFLIGEPNALIPLGLSYYSFKQIHYIFEIFKNKLRKHGLLEFLSYMFLLPTLIVGPINRFPEYLRDIKRRRFDTNNLSEGLERIIHGYAKIIILANFLVMTVFQYFSIALFQDNPYVLSYLRSWFTWMNLYFQFSGYSDIAIGLSLISGFRVMENFNSPFLAENINDFWKRWHISLTSWVRDYIYFPFISFTRNHLIGILMAMVIIGLWHEFSGRYILWGLYHGAGIIIWQYFNKLKSYMPRIENKMIISFAKLISILLTLNFVVLSFNVTSHLYEYLLSILR